MYTGRLIESLLQAVERAERYAEDLGSIRSAESAKPRQNEEEAIEIEQSIAPN